MWERSRITEALEFIKRHDMTALVLHETDFVHQVVFPRAYFDPYALWRSAPTRRGENAIQNNRIYFDSLLQLARRYGVEVWVEVKELGFPDEVLEIRPELLKDGVICPSEPYWFEFVEWKTAELIEDFPLLAGMIVSIGSPEGRASRAQNKCRCALCARTPLVEWYSRLILALHRPLAMHGKRLAIRDFAYKPEDHAPLIEAVGRAPDDVIFCMKATPHDFYPTFPDNPAIGRLDRTQWLEYDVQGQFYSWGVFPCFVLDDLRQRLSYAERNGVTGGVFRTEWERVNDWWCLESINVLNLIAAAALSKGMNVDAAAVCRTWLRDKSWPEQTAPWLARILMETWPIVRRALYVQGYVFADCSMYPRSVGRAWWTMEHKHSLEAWAPDRRGSLDLDEEKVAASLAEKDEARRRIRELALRVQQGDPVLDPDLHGCLANQFELFETYVEGFYWCAKVCLYTRWSEAGALNEVQLNAFDDALAGLEAFGESLRATVECGKYPHQLVMLMDYRRVADIVAEGRSARAAIST